MTRPDNLLPVASIAHYLPQLQALADALSVTDAMQAIVDSNDALQHPQLSQYVCGVEHLNLAIAYLERAIGLRTDASLDYNPEPDYGQGVPDVEVQRATGQDEPYLDT